MGVMGEHAAHILELQFSPRPGALPRRRLRSALKLRSLLTLTDVLIVDRDIFGIDPLAIGDTKVGTTIGGKDRL